MTTTDHSFLTFETRYMELLYLAERANAAEVLVNASDWHLLTRIVGKSGIRQNANGTISLEINGRRFTHKLPTKPPSGILDLSDPEQASFDA